MTTRKAKNSLVKFLSTNNLMACAIVVAALIPFYQSRLEQAERIHDLETSVAQTAQVVEQNEQANEATEPLTDVNLVADQVALRRSSVAEATAAKAGITNRQFELISGYCTRFARQVVEHSHGKKYAQYFKADAVKTANAFLKSPYGYRYPRDRTKLKNVIQVGDLLFKTNGSGGYGHVGVYVGNIPGIGKQLVAENSSTSIGRIQGAKGYRTLAQFNSGIPFDVLVRLPLPTKK